MKFTRCVRLTKAHPIVQMSNLRAPLFVGAVVFGLTGCAVGPDFKKPMPPDVTDYTAHPLSPTVATAGVTGGQSQYFVGAADISGDWWSLFHSKPINDLIEQALANNPDLKAAQSALSAAKESVLAQKGAFFPSVSASFSASHEQSPNVLSPVPNANVFQFNLFTPQVSVSYDPDVFGLNRRTVESLQAQADVARFQMIATYTNLTANVVVTAIQEASVGAQISAVRDIVNSDTRTVQILDYQFHKGYASGLDLAAQKAQLAQANSLLPPLLKQQAQLHDLMAVLTGRFPSQSPADILELSSLSLPGELPVSLPASLVEQRPDVRQAEENLHAASAEIGIAVANRLPNIELTAGGGSSALAIAQLFAPGTTFWTVGAALVAPIFDGGTLLHRERGARASYEQAAQQYRSTVLTAFQNVADTLAALQQDADALRASSEAAEAAHATLTISQRQMRDGYAGYLAVLSAEQADQQAQVNLVQAQAARYADTAALFQALGGGWWHRTELASDDHAH